MRASHADVEDVDWVVPANCSSPEAFDKSFNSAVEIACLISCERVNGGENREVKWAYVVVWRDVKQRNTAVVVDLYFVFDYSFCGAVWCVRRGARVPGRDREPAPGGIRHRRTSTRILRAAGAGGGVPRGSSGGARTLKNPNVGSAGPSPWG